MKKDVFSLFLAAMFTCAAASVHAQVVSSLNETFDVACVTTPYFANNWHQYTPTSSVPYSPGQWTCSGANGRNGTPGMMCTGYYNNVYNLDTSYLITPTMNLNNINGDVYLHFDSRVAEMFEAGKLSLLTCPSPEFSIGVVDLTAGVTPIIGSLDVAGWVTHEVKLNSLKGTGNFYLAFRYTSVTTSGSVWYLDNITTDTTSFKVEVPRLTKDMLSMSVIGIPTNNEITISYSSDVAGTYQAAIYDMVGREVYNTFIAVQPGSTNYSITGLNLHPGMYSLKLNNATTCGITKVMIR